jgi:hypothetical protein
VAAPPQILEALVRDELRGPVQEIVRRLVPSASFTGGEEIEMWVCESCGHIEFFMPKK